MSHCAKRLNSYVTFIYDYDQDVMVTKEFKLFAQRDIGTEITILGTWWQ